MSRICTGKFKVYIQIRWHFIKGTQVFLILGIFRGPKTNPPWTLSDNCVLSPQHGWPLPQLSQVSATKLSLQKAFLYNLCLWTINYQIQEGNQGLRERLEEQEKGGVSEGRKEP